MSLARRGFQRSARMRSIYEKTSNNEGESGIVTGVAWYRPEQWQSLREASEDVENLEESYEAWL